MHPETTAFVTGLTAELSLLKNTPYHGLAGGGTPQGAADAAARLIASGATALISFGLAGGLNPGLAPGALLIPATIIEAGTLYACDPALLAWLGGPTATALLAGTAIAVTAAEKSALFTATGADAVDLESGALARLAAAQNIPFAALRAVCDPAHRTLPQAALIALTPAGRIGLAPVIASVLRHPTQLPALLALARDAAAARAALKAKLQQLT